MKCSLCQNEAQLFYAGSVGKYFRCSRCAGISLSPEFFLSARDEKARYETHNNNPLDTRYQKFVSPIVDEIERAFSADKTGLDFGCGTGPVIQYLLNRKGFSVELYDPFFNNNTSVLNKNYDLIACCEVIEHFHRPAQEFVRLFDLLYPGGRLFCMTHLYDETIDFQNWYYKDDSTHVFFYSEQTVGFIGETFGFVGWRMNDRLVVFEKGV